MGKPIQYESGTTFGKWTVVSAAGSRSNKLTWNVKCECGNESAVAGGDLRSGKSTCCGCDHSSGVTHGMTNTPIYGAWAAMITRCANPKAIKYANYGGRGIKVCERWMKFENFYADMGDRPRGCEIDRIDNDGNYEPGNCRWVTKSQNRRNTSANVFVEYKGRRVTVAEAAELSGIPYHALKTRVQKGDTGSLFRPLRITSRSKT